MNIGKINRPNVVIEARIIKADGTEVDLGVICDSRKEKDNESLRDKANKLLEGGK
jgi:hypothetical protein